MLEGDGAERRLGQRHGRCRRGDAGGRVEDLDQPFGRAGDGLQRAQHFRDRGEGVGRHQRVDHELRQLAGGDRAVEHRLGAPPDQRDERGGDDEHDAADERGAAAKADHFGLIGTLGALGIDARLHRLLDEALDGLAGAQRLGRHRRHFGERVLGAARHLAQAPGQQQHRQNDQRHDDDHGERQIEAGEKHQHQRADDGDHAAQGHRQARADGAADGGDVAIEARGQFADAVQCRNRSRPASAGDRTLPGADRVRTRSPSTETK